MGNKLRVGLIGGGWIVAWHAPGFRDMAEACEVAAVSDVDERRFASVAELVNNPDIHTYTDWREMLDREHLDCVDISLPHHLHLSAVRDAARAGVKHILCEKVMARNTWECQRMIDICRENGATLVICHDRRYAGDWVALKELIAQGQLGRTQYYHFEHNGYVAPFEGALGWVATRDKVGGGAMMSCLTHQFDALRWMEGEAQAVSCMTKILPGQMQGDIISVVSVRMQSGALALVNINWDTDAANFQKPERQDLLPYEFIQVCGSEGDAFYRYGEGTFFKRHGDDRFQKVVSRLDTTSHGHRELIRQYVRFCLGEPNTITTFGEDSIKSVQIAEAAYNSDASGRHVTLPIPQVEWEKRAYMK